MGSQREQRAGARVAVLASDEASRALVRALSGFPAAEVKPLPWPAPAASTPTPDLVVCEIQDARQALDRCRELGRVWPGALLVSCERAAGRSPAGTRLGAASRAAGYHGHVLLDEAALHLPFFLRYAEQWRKAESQLARRERLLAAASRMHASLDQQRVAAAILQEFGHWVRADNWLLYAISDDGQSLELALAEGARTRPPLLTLAVGGPGHLARALRQGEIMVSSLGQAETEPAEGRPRSSSSALCLPLIAEAQPVGVIEALRQAESGAFESLDEPALRELSRLAATALNNARRFAQAERLYMQDDLTRLYNGRYLRQFLEGEIKRARRYRSRVSVIFIDIDGFKQVNDRYGHVVGSETLKEVAGLLADSVRETDVVARYGGDEFMIVLPETSAERALATAERIRQHTAGYRFSGGSGHRFHLTASFGIATYPTHAQAAAELIEKADLAMYEAKAGSKNDVKVAE